VAGKLKYFSKLWIYDFRIFGFRIFGFRVLTTYRLKTYRISLAQYGHKFVPRFSKHTAHEQPPYKYAAMAVCSLFAAFEDLAEITIIGRNLSCQIRSHVPLSTSYSSLSQRNSESSALLQDDTHCSSASRKSQKHLKISKIVREKWRAGKA
jgi:hypothetical protein